MQPFKRTAARNNPALMFLTSMHVKIGYMMVKLFLRILNIVIKVRKCQKYGIEDKYAG